MNSLVFLQVTFLGEAFATPQAKKRLLSRVSPLVHVKSTLLDEAFATDKAAVGLLACVRSLVGVQVPFLGVPLPTQRAMKGFLARVAPLMGLQLTEAPESLAAVGAYEAPVPPAESFVTVPLSLVQTGPLRHRRHFLGAGI